MLTWFVFTVVGSRFVCGSASLDGGQDLLTVRVRDGRSKSAQVGGMPAEVLAKVLLRELCR